MVRDDDPVTHMMTSPPVPTSPVTPSGRCPAPPPCSPCPSPPPSPSPPPWPQAPHPSSLASMSRVGLPRLDPQRRHSWQPQQSEQTAALWTPQYQQRSVSLEGLDPEEFESLLLGRLSSCSSSSSVQSGRDPRRTPITSYGQLFPFPLLSHAEEEAELESQPYPPSELQGWRPPGASHSLAPHAHTHAHGGQHQHSQPQSSQFSQYDQYRPCQRSHSTASCHHGSWISLGGDSLSVDVDLEEAWGAEEWRHRGRERETPEERGRTTEGEGARPPAGVQEEVEKEAERRNGKATGSSLGRTFSFLRTMATQRKNKEKERMKEREKEAREREARYSNGHLFTSLTVSATTLCSACNKSITAKEALSCPTCNVTIHNRCRDTLDNCTKMKQRQQKLSLVRNSAALQNVSLRNKTPAMKERPSSAIYPSDSLRSSLLGSRRVRSGLSGLSKSVSTTNIAGNLNDDSPLGLRRILSQSTDSLNFRNRSMSMESINDEGEVYYASLLEDLEVEGKVVEKDSWSMVVDPSFLQTQRKDVMKRQDVIYELLQTEFHHVRTLKIMDGVFRQGMLDEVLLEPGVVHAMFPCLDQLLAIHTRFLAQLMARRTQGLAPGSHNNFTIHRLGDLLTQQFSGPNADDMRKAYSEFCSRHPKAVKLYKELLARDKRFQHLIRRVNKGPLLRRHGVQECILLVTQRITKYPVLIQRILDNTKGNDEEIQSLSTSLVLLKDMLSCVDQQVLDLQRTQRLQEIRSRLDPRAQAEVRGGGVFKGGELLRRNLIHEGTLLWKTQNSNRLKDVQVLLMSDILVFLQEKDQKYIFPSLDKPAVVSLNNLIVRDIANQERGMFLISHSTPPEMYELHAASKDDRNAWMKRIQQTVHSCPSREDFPLIETEDKALLRRLRADIQQKDSEVLELLQERVTLFSDLVEASGAGGGGVGGGGGGGGGGDHRNLFRADTPQAVQGERLLTEAITEVDKLSELLLGSNIELLSPVTNGNQNHTGSSVTNGDSLNSSYEVNGSSSSKDRNGNHQVQDRPLNQEVCHRLINLSTQLHALQATVIRQDSILASVCLRAGPALNSAPSATTANTPGGGGPPRLSRSVSRDSGLDAGLGGVGLGGVGLGGVGLGGVNLGGVAANDGVVLRGQLALLQEEVERLRESERLRQLELKEQKQKEQQQQQQVKEEVPPAGGGGGGGSGGRRRRRRGSKGSNGDSEELVKKRDGGDAESRPNAPLASQDPVDQLDGVQEGSDEDEELDVVKVSPRSDSPRDLQDIPEESEFGPESREAEHEAGTTPS